jgi:hypothetical protein
LVNETKTMGKFKRQDGSDVGATLMTELNPKMMMEDNQVWAGIECRT